MGLKEILKVSDEKTTLNIWYTQAISALESFLANIKASIQQHQLSLSPIAISYSNHTQSESIQKTAELLAYIFTQMGLPTTLCPLEDAAKLNTQLDGAGYAVVLCTREYAAKVSKGSPIWNVLDNFGKKKKNALHPLLCEGEFRDVALRIVDGHYLIRSIHAVLNQDPLITLPALVDIVFHLSGSQGLGLLPDVLNIKETVNAQSEAAYKKSFSQLQISIQKYTIDYRLKSSVEESVQHHSLKSYAERPKINDVVERFLPSEAKVGLFFCQNKADTLLTSLHLAEIFSKKSERVLTIDCGKYPGQASWDCVQKALKALKLKSTDIEAMKQEPLIIVLKGYQDLGAYDNLWVKNALSTWVNVKLLVTCQADYFKERGYLRCFLADVSNRRVEDIAVYPISTFASLEAQMAALSINITPDINQDVEQYPISDKRKAEYVELTRFLERLNQIWVEKDYLKSAFHQNPRLFISYAWEGDKIALARQQMYLSRIAQDFRTLGIPTWLDTEQMSGNIDEQMEKNIAESHGVLLIETPRYIERAQQATNVKKEWDAIYAKSQQQAEFRVFPIQYSLNAGQGNPALIITSFLANHANRCDFTQIDDDYIMRMTHPESGLIPRWLCDTPEKKILYQNAYASFQQDLQLLVGKHLVVNQGQNDVLAFDMNNRLKGYIAPFGLYTEDSPMDTRFDLVKYFEEFLNNNERKTAIVLGRAGSGKSLFALSTFRLFLTFWQQYQKGETEQPQATPAQRPRWLPLYIPLRNYAQHPEDAIQDALKQQFRLADADINALKQGLNHQQRILFILDGYDELGSSVRPNYAEVLKDWPHAKLLITSRPEHFDKDHRPLDVLTLKEADGKTPYNSAQEVHVSPFSPNEIEQYVKQYEESKESNTYQTLKDLPGMMGLLDNPFLLTLVLQSLPQLLANRQSSQESDIARTDIYDAFTQTWFLQETKGRELTPHNCDAFCQSLAYRLFSENTIKISDDKHNNVIWNFLLHQNNQSVKEAAPLRLSGGEYNFIHKSIYEYFVAKRFWRAILEPDWMSIWQTRLLTEEQSVVDLLAEMVRKERSSDKEKRLYEFIIASRNEDFPEMVSSNAVTVLNAAGVSFSGKDLDSIRIPRADLSGAILDNASLKNADLTQVILTDSWLHGTNFNNALMRGATFGEYPSIILEKEGNEIAYGCRRSPNGSYFVIRSGRNTLLFDAATHKLKHTLLENNGINNTFSPDENRLASYSFIRDETVVQTELEKRIEKRLASAYPRKLVVMIWSIKTGELERKLECDNFRRENFPLAFSPDGQILAFVNNENIVTLYAVESGEELHKILVSHTGSVTSVAFSPDGQFLASANDNQVAFNSIRQTLITGIENYERIVKVWSVTSGKLFNTIVSDTRDELIFLHYLRDKIILILCRNSVKVWNVSNDELKNIVKSCEKNNFLTFAINTKGQSLALTGDGSTVQLWSWTGELLKTLEGHTDVVTDLNFSPNEKLLASGSMDGTVKIWSVETGVLQVTLGNYISYNSLIFIGRNEQEILFSSNKKALKIYCIDNLKKHNPSIHKDSVVSVHWSPNGKLLASGSRDTTIKLWFVHNGLLHKTFNGHIDAVNSVHFSPDSKLLASGSCDKTIKLWDVNTGVLLKTIDVKLLASGSDHKTITLRGVIKTRVLLKTLDSQVQFSPDGKLLAFSDLNTIKLWSLEKEVLYQTLEVGPNNITHIHFSPDSQQLAAGARCSVRLCDVKSGRVLQDVHRYTSIFCINFSLDGRLWSSGGRTSRDTIRKGVVVLWVAIDTFYKTLSDGVPFNDIPLVNSACFSPDGRWLISGHSGRTLRLWDNLGVEENSHCYVTHCTSEILSLSSQGNEKGTFLVSGNADHSVHYWQLIQRDDKPYVQLLWSTNQNELLSQDANIAGAQGLSLNNADLLKQRGAIEDTLSVWVSPKLFSDDAKNASSSNSNSSSCTQNNNTQYQNESQGITKNAGANAPQEDKTQRKDCNIM